MNTSVHSLPPPPSRRYRSPLRKFLETRGTLGGHRASHVETSLLSRDGTVLAGTYLPGPRTDAPAVLLVHGFAANRRKPSYAYLADALSRDLHVLALDLRGHGESAGVSTLGDREWHDVAAGVAWLRAYGHRQVIVVGMSMGGTATVHALSRGVPADAAVVVSAPAWLREDPESEAMRELQAVWQSTVKRHAMRLLIGVRVVAPTSWVAPPDPAVAIRGVGQPVLVVHGADDSYFPVEDGRALAAGAGGPATLWERPAGFGHAEDGIDAPFAVALARAILHAARQGRFPEQAEVWP